MKCTALHENVLNGFIQICLTVKLRFEEMIDRLLPV